MPSDRNQAIIVSGKRWGNWSERSMRNFLGVMEMFYIFVSWVYKTVKIHSSILLRHVHFVLYKCCKKGHTHTHAPQGNTMKYRSSLRYLIDCWRTDAFKNENTMKPRAFWTKLKGEKYCHLGNVRSNFSLLGFNKAVKINEWPISLLPTSSIFFMISVALWTSIIWGRRNIPIFLLLNSILSGLLCNWLLFDSIQSVPYI